LPSVLAVAVFTFELDAGPAELDELVEVVFGVGGVEPLAASACAGVGVMVVLLAALAAAAFRFLAWAAAASPRD
jgi:hypothetical protein